MKKYTFLLFLIGYFTPCLSQTHKIYLVGLPNITSVPKIRNPSPADISGSKRRFGLESKILYNYSFPSQFGVLVGLSAGFVNWDNVVVGPRSAFGTQQGTGFVGSRIVSGDFHFIGGTFGSTYDGVVRKINYHIEFGVSLRMYPRETYPDTTGMAFNRLVEYNSKDPNAGPPDFLNVVPAFAGRIHPQVFASLTFPLRISERSSLYLGISKNLNIQPMGKGKMFVQYYKNFYNGEFSPRSSYLGLDVRYRYGLSKK
jgi:hypothetical protein